MDLNWMYTGSSNIIAQDLHRFPWDVHMISIGCPRDFQRNSTGGPYTVYSISSVASCFLFMSITDIIRISSTTSVAVIVVSISITSTTHMFSTISVAIMSVSTSTSSITIT